MRKLLGILALLIGSTATAQSNFCAGKQANTFYCVNDTQFQHCIGNDGFVLKSCPKAICVTRTPAIRNPCVGRDAAAREDGQQPPIVDEGEVVQAPIEIGKPPVVVVPPPAVGGDGVACVGGPKFDPAGAKNVGNGIGIQFIGGQCLSGKDCASGCCAGPCGICSGPGAQFQAGKTGCGFSR